MAIEWKIFYNTGRSDVLRISHSRFPCTLLLDAHSKLRLRITGSCHGKDHYTGPGEYAYCYTCSTKFLDFSNAGTVRAVLLQLGEAFNEPLAAELWAEEAMDSLLSLHDLYAGWYSIDLDPRTLAAWLSDWRVDYAAGKV